MQTVHETISALCDAITHDAARTLLAKALQDSKSNEVVHAHLELLVGACDSWAMARAIQPLLDQAYTDLHGDVPIHEQHAIIKAVTVALFDMRARDDARMSAQALAEKFWRSDEYLHPDMTCDKWRHAVYLYSTRLGYWDWVACQLQQRFIGQTA